MKNKTQNEVENNLFIKKLSIYLMKKRKVNYFD